MTSKLTKRQSRSEYDTALNDAARLVFALMGDMKQGQVLVWPSNSPTMRLLFAMGEVNESCRRELSDGSSISMWALKGWRNEVMKK